MNSRTESTTDTESETALSPLFKVVLLDDDEHTYDYVVEMLCATCDLSRESAFRCAVEVDLMGRTTVFYGNLEKCRHRAALILGYGADPRLPRSRGSMKAEVHER